MSNPGDDTALIIPVVLPGALDSLRRRATPDATEGLSPHVTLLYPFERPEALDDGIRGHLKGILAGHRPFSFRLVKRGEWPGVLFISVEPETPFRALYRDLLAAFPAFPIHRGMLDYVPHLTIAVGQSASAIGVRNDPAWGLLPVTCEAQVADLVVRGPDGWAVRWRFDLRMPPRRKG